MDWPELSVPWCILGRRETAVRDRRGGVYGVGVWQSA